MVRKEILQDIDTTIGRKQAGFYVVKIEYRCVFPKSHLIFLENTGEKVSHYNI